MPCSNIRSLRVGQRGIRGKGDASRGKPVTSCSLMCWYPTALPIASATEHCIPSLPPPSLSPLLPLPPSPL